MKSLNKFTDTGYADALIDFKVIDENRDEIGTLHSLWLDQKTEELEFLGVKTGWLFGSNHIIPAEQAQADEELRLIQVPFTKEYVKGAPSHEVDAQITDEQEAEIYHYYRIGKGDIAVLPAPAIGQETDKTATRVGSDNKDIEVALSEEQLKVGKRSVTSGAVRLRKIVRTEQVQVPVELRSEDVVIERVGPGEVTDVAGSVPFDGKTIDVVLHKEEAVVSKEAHVTGAVRVRKTEEIEHATVSDSVRKEKAEVTREGSEGTSPTYAVDPQSLETASSS